MLCSSIKNEQVNNAGDLSIVLKEEDVALLVCYRVIFHVVLF